MQALLLRVATQLPPPARSLVTEARIRLLVQFFMFGTVGTFGWAIDTCVVYALRGQLGLYGAGAVSYCVAASFTWLCNRLWTFRGLGDGPAHRQWVRFLAVNTVGFILNRGTYALTIAFIPLFAREPIFATAAGAIAGMFMNFGLSRAIVFR